MPSDDYRSAGFAGRLGFGGRGALIVVDVMMSYFEKSSPMYAGVENIIPSNVRLIELAYAKKIPVFFTQQFYEKPRDDGIYVRKIPALKLLRRGSPLTAIHPALPVSGGSVFVKHYPSAFHRTDLAVKLKEHDVDTLIITGLTTSGCIRATAMDALLNELTGIVVREAVGDRSQPAHEANLFDIDAKLADVAAEAEVIAWMKSR